ncbi:MAG: nodulation protein NfeD [Desulfobacterales bacterium]|jgi:membrane-bound serine protease (ClpP class)|nr:nodulation protein NfeD [Desulfobacterales bacterium]
MKNRTVIFGLWLVIFWGLGQPARAASGDVYVMTLSGSINPGVAEFVQSGVQKAVAENAACLIIQLDTPGGLAESMRQIVQSILGSPVPIVVYVSPAGARAASAGVMITIAADIAAMAPGTNIGAAHPVNAGGKDIDETMSAKVTNDMVAHARSVAEKRGRNADWVEAAIRDSVSVTETEALKKMVIDLVAKDVKDLIAQIDGKEILGKGKLNLADAAIEPIVENLRTKVLKTISDPNIAYILMMIGLAGLYFEMSHPGVVLPGVIGAVCLVLAFFAFQTLPVNYAGILLILLALVFFFLELKVTSYGMLSIAGIGSLLLGSLMLFEGGEKDPGMRLAWTVLLPTVFLVSGFFVLIAGLVVRSQMSQPRTGASGLIGEIGVVKTPLTPNGKVFVHGELWHATAASPIEAGVRVRVTKVTNLVLEVEKAE